MAEEQTRASKVAESRDVNKALGSGLTEIKGIVANMQAGIPLSGAAGP